MALWSLTLHRQTATSRKHLYHHPVVCVHKHFHEPPVTFIRVKFTKQHEIAKHHQPFNVMTISGLQNFPDHDINGFYPGTAISERSGDLLFKSPVIFSSLFAALSFINDPDEFAPANHLPGETFQ